MRHAGAWGEGKGPADTVWMGVIDGDGLAVSMIQSIHHEFGSGVVRGVSGITWQNRGASFSLNRATSNVLATGKKPFHTLNRALALLSDGRTMVYGHLGGDGQPQKPVRCGCGIAGEGAARPPRLRLRPRICG